MVVVVVEVVVEVVEGVSVGKEYMVINRDNQMYSNTNNQASNNNQFIFFNLVLLILEFKFRKIL